MIKNLLNFGDNREDIVAQIARMFKHHVQLFINVLMKTRWNIGFHLDVAVDDEIPHLFIGELQCWFIHFVRPPLFHATRSKIQLRAFKGCALIGRSARCQHTPT